ncbi:MAG: hypothetical protein IT384_30280 [Deltaproteobacteria bacterium]|nr:hypothetical protein [Deltaproteobacteria bacterium]
MAERNDLVRAARDTMVRPESIQAAFLARRRSPEPGLIQDDETLSWEVVDARRMALASGLMSLILHPGMSCAVIAHPRRMTGLTLLAPLSCGARLVLIDARAEHPLSLLLGPVERVESVERVEIAPVELAIVDDDRIAARLATERPRGLRAVVHLAGGEGAGFVRSLPAVGALGRTRLAHNDKDIEERFGAETGHLATVVSAGGELRELQQAPQIDAFRDRPPDGERLLGAPIDDPATAAEIFAAWCLSGNALDLRRDEGAR